MPNISTVILRFLPISYTNPVGIIVSSVIRPELSATNTVSISESFIKNYICSVVQKCDVQAWLDSPRDIFCARCCWILFRQADNITAILFVPCESDIIFVGISASIILELFICPLVLFVISLIVVYMIYCLCLL